MRQLKRIETVVIVPGVPGNGPKHWQNRLADQCMDHGLKVLYPRLDPEREDVRLSENLGNLKAAISGISDLETTAFICHSLGCMTVLQLLKSVGIDRVGLAVFVAPSALSKASVNIPPFMTYFKGLLAPVAFHSDQIEVSGKALVRLRTKMHELHIITSDNDPRGDLQETRRMVDFMMANSFVIPGAGHIGDQSGITEIPGLFEHIRLRAGLQ